MKAYEREALLAVTVGALQKERKRFVPTKIHKVGKLVTGPAGNLCGRTRFRHAPRMIEEGDECPACDECRLTPKKEGGLVCRRCKWECDEGGESA